MPSLADFFDQSEITPAAIGKIAREIIPPTCITDAIMTHPVQEQRHRDLLAILMVWLCIAMGWQPRRSSQSVLTRLLIVNNLKV